MVSHTTLTVISGYASAFWCLDALSEASKIQTSSSFSRLDAAALVLLATYGLTSLLLFAHVHVLGVANADDAATARRRRYLHRLANAAWAATSAALLSGAVLRLGAHGYLGGADDVG